MQNRADIIAAFAIIFGKNFSEKNFHRGAMNSPSGGDEPSTMTIWGPERTSIEIPIRFEGTSNYLGGIYDLDYSGADMLK